MCHSQTYNSNNVDLIGIGRIQAQPETSSLFLPHFLQKTAYKFIGIRQQLLTSIILRHDSWKRFVGFVEISHLSYCKGYIKNAA